jgi:O-antigen/teichoic acid export membrane protein
MTFGSTKKRFAVNVAMNWVATAVNMVVPFLLTPFVVHHLGRMAYGVWVLAVSTTSYLGLLDLGLRSAIIRFVSKANAQGQFADAAACIGAALWLRVLMAAVIAPVSVVIAFASPHFLKIPPNLIYAGQVSILLCGVSVGVTMISGVFGAVLSALNRFDLLSSVTVVQTVFRAAGVLLLLSNGHGLVSLACWELCVLVCAGAALVTIACRIFPPARTRVKKPEVAVLSPLWTYSATTFVYMIAVQVVWNTDSIVVGSVLSVGLVAFYSIGSSLVNYSAQVAQAISTTFTPMASGLEASGRAEQLQEMLIRGTQGMLAFSLPFAAALFFRGGTFISLWMGPQYRDQSETVLRILMISLFFSMANATAASIMMAIEKHRPVARWAVYEAVLNLGLSLVLAKKVGLYGVAWGTSISLTFVHLVFWPSYVQKVLGVPRSRYLIEGWSKITLCTVPFALASAITERMWSANNLVVFFSQILLILPIYIGCVILAFRKDVSAAILRWRNA